MSRGSMKDQLGDTLYESRQPGLFENNAAHLQRVSGRIAPAVLDFCRANAGKEFHMEALVAHIREKVGIAPDSPSRILRMLRQEGKIDYEVMDRRASLYLIKMVQKERGDNGKTPSQRT